MEGEKQGDAALIASVCVWGGPKSLSYHQRTSMQKVAQELEGWGGVGGGVGGWDADQRETETQTKKPTQAQEKGNNFGEIRQNQPFSPSSFSQLSQFI